MLDEFRDFRGLGGEGMKQPGLIHLPLRHGVQPIAPSARDYALPVRKTN